jgi:hypothetical protein
MSSSLKRQIIYRPGDGSGKIPYYPGAAGTKELLKGYANKNNLSMSKAVDKLISPVFRNMSPDEKKLLRIFAKQKD